MPVPHEILYIAPFVIVLAFIVFGATGFGSALVTVPILAHFLPLTFVVPLSLLLDFAAAFLSGTRFRREVDKREIRALLPFGIVGIAVGAALLVNIPRQPALLVLGVLIGAYGLYRLGNDRAAPHTISRAWSVPTGLLGGMIGALFGTEGPLFVIYLSRRLTDTRQLKATLAAIFALLLAGRIVAFAVSGLLLRRDLLLSALLLFPLMLLGLRIGHALHARLPRRSVMQAIHLLLSLSGASLAFRALTAG